jgi:putative CocE/NonD family hydrolase
MRNNITYPYVMQWLTFTSGHTAQDRIFGDPHFWAAKYRQWFESGAPFAELDTIVGNPSPVFRTWIAHPQVDAYWDSYNPTSQEYAKLSLPILTITGSYDGDQPGALAHYREHMTHASPEARAKHYLVIGPWDHAGTRTPSASFGGLTFGPASLVDLPQLHIDWYGWTMQGGAKPAFLQKNVAYYVMGADKWRYADSLEAVTGEARPYFLGSNGGAGDVLAAGSLRPDKPGAKSESDRYIYDPRDVSDAAAEASLDPELLTDQTLIYAQTGKQLIYHTAAFDKDTEISGTFRLSAWIVIDQPDTDFIASIYEIRPDGSSILLTTDQLRARYRESLREPKLVTTKGPLRYDFDRFTFVSRQIAKGSRLRLRIAPVNSIYSQKNYNSGKNVIDERLQDARPVTVNLYHEAKHPSALYVPFGKPVQGATE